MRGGADSRIDTGVHHRGRDRHGPPIPIRPPGPTLTRNEQGSCLDAIERLSATARFVVASGSLPPGVPTDFYQRVSAVVQGSEARFVLDSSGEALRQVHSGVFLLKPSIRELRDLTGRTLETPSDQVRAARELIEAGVCARVVVSLGSRGALAVTPDSQYAIPALPKEVRSGVGAGDSLVAGTVVGLCRGSSFGEAVRLGVAASAAMLMTPGTAACTRDQVEQCRSELHGMEGTSGATENGGELVREADLSKDPRLPLSGTRGTSTPGHTQAGSSATDLCR